MKSWKHSDQTGHSYLEQNYFQCPDGIWRIYSKIIAHYATQLRRLTQAKLRLPSSH